MIANAKLEHIQASFPHLFSLAQSVVSQWPQHEDYLARSIHARSSALLKTSDQLAAAVLQLAEQNIREHVEDYCWLCDRIREEELFFARNDRYRYASFAEANDNVYSNKTMMRKYMNGLLYSQALWYMHASSLHFFWQRLAARLKDGGKVLEVGSGHGLLLFLALRELKLSEAVAWDLSEVSLDQTRQALKKLSALDRARFTMQDINNVAQVDEKFDLIILSHLLEHLENPVEVLKKMRGVVRGSGYIFVNVPLNAPMPDHIILLRTPDAAGQLLTDGGYRVVEMATHTSQAVSLSKALRLKMAVTCSIIAEVA